MTNNGRPTEVGTNKTEDRADLTPSDIDTLLCGISAWGGNVGSDAASYIDHPDTECRSIAMVDSIHGESDSDVPISPSRDKFIQRERGLHKRPRIRKIVAHIPIK